MPRRPLRRVRRPLIALVALVVILGIGYGVKAARADTPRPVPVGTVSRR